MMSPTEGPEAWILAGFWLVIFSILFGVLALVGWGLSIIGPDGLKLLIAVVILGGLAFAVGRAFFEAEDNRERLVIAGCV